MTTAERNHLLDCWTERLGDANRAIESVNYAIQRAIDAYSLEARQRCDGWVVSVEEER